MMMPWVAKNSDSGGREKKLEDKTKDTKFTTMKDLNFGMRFSTYLS